MYYPSSECAPEPFLDDSAGAGLLEFSEDPLQELESTGEMQEKIPGKHKAHQL